MCATEKKTAYSSRDRGFNGAAARNLALAAAAVGNLLFGAGALVFTRVFSSGLFAGLLNENNGQYINQT